MSVYMNTFAADAPHGIDRSNEHNRECPNGKGIFGGAPSRRLALMAKLHHDHGQRDKFIRSEFTGCQLLVASVAYDRAPEKTSLME